MRRKTRNITGRNVTNAGTRLNSGLNTITNFDLVTAVTPKWLSEHVRMRFPSSAGATVDYFSDYNHISQFKTSAGAFLIDGNNYANRNISSFSQFIAPVDCYLKSVSGFISPQSGSGCGAETIIISIWKKSAVVAGTSTSAMNLLFTQSFIFNASSNQYILAIDGRTDSRVNNPTSYTIPAKEGVIVSVKRGGIAAACADISASFSMVFELIEDQATTSEFMFPSLSGSNHRIDETISSPDENYRFLGTTAKKISE